MILIIKHVKDKKKLKIGHGRVLVYFDGYMELDFEHYGDNRPVLTFLRTIYDKFIFKAYTERFEQRLTHDMTHLYHHVMKFLNMYQKYNVV